MEPRYPMIQRVYSGTSCPFLSSFWDFRSAQHCVRCIYFLIKDNHIAAAGGSIDRCVAQVRRKTPEKAITLEVSCVEELEQALR